MLQEGDKRQLREASVHPPSSERYAHTFRDLSNFSGTINVTYRYLAGTPLNRKSKSEGSLFSSGFTLTRLVSEEAEPNQSDLKKRRINDSKRFFVLVLNSAKSSPQASHALFPNVIAPKSF